jgi:ligand-binding sensor protein
MLSFKAPLTQEAAVLGLVNLGQFYLSETVETLSLALSTPGSLKSALRQWSQRPDLLNSLTNVHAIRADKDQASRPRE